jgi:hypothetical protein
LQYNTLAQDVDTSFADSRCQIGANILSKKPQQTTRRRSRISKIATYGPLLTGLAALVTAVTDAVIKIGKALNWW